MHGHRVTRTLRSVPAGIRGSPYEWHLAFRTWLYDNLTIVDQYEETEGTCWTEGSCAPLASALERWFDNRLQRAAIITQHNYCQLPLITMQLYELLQYA